MFLGKQHAEGNLLWTIYKLNEKNGNGHCHDFLETELVRNMHVADTKENALKAYDKFIETFETKYEKAVENLKKD